MDKINKIYEAFKSNPVISTDTRKEVKGTIFFALSGDQFNGNAYAENALERGASLIVVDEEEYCCSDNCVLVENTLKTLQQLAMLHRINHPIQVVGITGSNGKTTTKELVSAVVGSSKNIIATEGNFNNHIGVPLTLLRIKKETELAIVEMGANHIGEIAALCEIAKPDIGIITNIGKAHLEGFGSFEGVVKAKSELYNFLEQNNGIAIVNANDDILMSLSTNLHRVTYGSEHAGINVNLSKTFPSLILDWEYETQKHNLYTQLYGEYNLPNVSAAIATGVYFNIKADQINASLSAYVPQNNRSQQLVTTSNSIVLDAYNANPVSMTAAISSFKENVASNAWLILGDMFELGQYSAEEHENIIMLVQSLGFKNVLFIGYDFYKFNDLFAFNFCETTDDAKQFLSINKVRNANILVKGSRGMKLETLLNLL